MAEGEVVARFPKIYAPLDDDWRYKILYGGRAAARSWSISRKLLLRGTQRPEFILCTRELQKSIKQSVHRLLKKQIRLLGLQNFYDVKEQSIKGINGTEFMFLGIKANPEEVRSTEGITICWIEEGHSLSESSWDIIDPTIREEGSEIWVSFNTRFKFDHVYKLFVVDKSLDDALVIKSSSDDNPYLSTVLKKQRAALKKSDYEKYLHIWEGELKMLAEGAIFGKQVIQAKQDGRLLSIPVSKQCLVDTFWDIGKSDHTSIWFMQRVGMEYRFIDFYMGRLEEVEHYAKVLRKFDYNYGRHYFPHDADHDRLGMKKNIKEQFIALGVKPITIVPVIKVKQTAIELARNIFGECWFHQGTDARGQRMEKGWEALCNYRYKYNDDDDVYQKKPHHDWASNPADAFMQFAQGHVDTKAMNAPIIMNSGFKIF